MLDAARCSTCRYARMSWSRSSREPTPRTSRRERPAARALATLVKDNAGVTVGVDVLEPGLLERSAGKAQRLLDLR